LDIIRYSLLSFRYTRKFPRPYFFPKMSVKSLRIRYFFNGFLPYLSSFPQTTVAAIVCLLVASHSGITLQHEQSKRTEAVSSPFHRAAQSKVAWEDCNKQEYRLCLAAYPLQHVRNDSEGKSPPLCTHLKAVPLLICAASKIQWVQGVGEGGYHCGNSRFRVWSRSTGWWPFSLD
jgi:hypothetical protein